MICRDFTVEGGRRRGIENAVSGTEKPEIPIRIQDESEKNQHGGWTGTRGLFRQGSWVKSHGVTGNHRNTGIILIINRL